MLKNIMFWFMSACATLRLGSLGYILWTGDSNLPATVAIISAVTGILILAFIAKKYLFGCKRREMEIIFAANSFAVLFNIMYVRFTCLATLGMAELLIIGSFFEILAGGTFIYLSRRRTKYVTVSQGGSSDNN